jgi:hypothetical protein
MSTVVFKFKTKTEKRGRIRLQPGEKKEAPVGSTPRITKLMALAIKFDALVRSGQVKDYAELARLGHVTRARMSQIMSLLNLAPEIQEAILFLPKTVRGRDAVCAREVIRLAAEVDWERQRSGWGRQRTIWRQMAR